MTGTNAADLEFFFDPVCPWAWITSRWVKEVQALRHYSVTWRPISLKLLNANNTADWYNDQYKRWHAMGHEALRLAVHLEATAGNQAVDSFYTACGIECHANRRRDDFATSTEVFMAEVLTNAGLDPSLARYAFDESLDTVIAAETELALSRTGRDVGTPIITFKPGADNEGSFFGPVIARIPRGDEALRLWDAVETLATTPGVAELKRTQRGSPVFD